MRTNICIRNMVVTVVLMKQWRRLGAVCSGTINLWHPRFSSWVLTTSCSFGIHRWRIISRKYHRGLGIKIKLIAGRRSLCLYGAAMPLPLTICTSCVRLGFVKVFLALFLSLQPVYSWQSPLKCWEERKRLLFLKELASHRPGLEDDNERQPPLSSRQSSGSSGKRRPAGPVPFPRDKAAWLSALPTAAEARACGGTWRWAKCQWRKANPAASGLGLGIEWVLLEEQASLAAKDSASARGLQPGRVLGCWAWARTAEAGPSCLGGWVTFCSLTEFLSKLARSFINPVLVLHSSWAKRWLFLHNADTLPKHLLLNFPNLFGFLTQIAAR